MKLADAGFRFGRQILRGLSQCAFQANEITGVLFVLAVATFSWRMAVFYVVSTILGTLTAWALKADDKLLDQGLLGFNSALMGLALGHFFQPSLALWLWMAVFAVVTAAVTVAMSKWIRFPFLAAPFILTFWAMWPIADVIGLTKIELGAFPAIPWTWSTAIASALGSTLFSPTPISGLIFIFGVAISSWRHAVIAVVGGLTAIALAAHVGAVGGAISSGFVGFNAVLAALAAYSIVAEDFRFVALAAILSTWLASYVYRGAPVPVLASGFVVAIWFELVLAWLNPRFAGRRP
jgi:urea transporter